MSRLTHLNLHAGYREDTVGVVLPDDAPSSGPQPKPRGPYAYENWLAFLGGGPFENGFEFPLYSDAEFRPQADKFWGPYTLFNTLSGTSPYNTVRPLFVLRTDLHLKPASLVNPDRGRTDVARYLGGGPELELAALCSLAMGIRLKPGGMTRVFNSQPEYPQGMPVGGDVEGATRRTGGVTTGILPEVARFEVTDVDRVATSREVPVLVQLRGPEAAHLVVGVAESVGQLALRGPQPPQHVCRVMVVKGPPVVGVDVAHVGPCRS